MTEKEAILPAELFKEKIIPILINIFHVREMQIRLVLLNFFPNYVGMFSKTQLEVHQNRFCGFLKHLKFKILYTVKSVSTYFLREFTVG